KIDDIVKHPSLLTWVESALQDPKVAEQSGATDESTEEATRLLTGECLDLLNDLLLLHHVMGYLPEYKRAIADAEIESFWNNMRRGVQVFEVGRLLHDFISDARQEPVVLGLRS